MWRAVSLPAAHASVKHYTVTVSSRFLHNKFRIRLVIKDEDCGHNCVSLGGDTPAARPGDFGNEAADMNPLEKTRDLLALATYVPRFSARAEELAAKNRTSSSHAGLNPR